MNKVEIDKRLIDYLKKELSIEDQNISLDDSFQKLEPYGMNSIYFVKIIIELEQIFHVDFEDDYLLISHYQTIGELADYIWTLVKINESESYDPS